MENCLAENCLMEWIRRELSTTESVVAPKCLQSPGELGKVRMCCFDCSEVVGTKIFSESLFPKESSKNSKIVIPSFTIRQYCTL